MCLLGGLFRVLWRSAWCGLFVWPFARSYRAFLHTPPHRCPARARSCDSVWLSFITPPSFTMAERKAVIKNADMSEDMQQDAVDCASQALEKFNIEKDIAAFIKKEFDKKYTPTWHCIVGRNFGSYVTHETKHFIYFYLGQVAILLFKSG